MEDKYTSVAVDDVHALCEYIIAGHTRAFPWRFDFTVCNCSVDEIVSRVYREFYNRVSALQLPFLLVSFSLKSIKIGERVIL